MQLSTSQLVFLTTAAISVVLHAQDIRLPPSIINGVDQTYTSPNDGKIVLNCSYVGQPAPIFSWMKNNVDLPSTDIIYPYPDEGTIEFIKTVQANEGRYQCLVSNLFGKTMTDVAVLRVATLADYPPGVPATPFPVQANRELRVPCHAPASFPDATYSWWFNTTTNPTFAQLTTSRRIQIDFNGDLCFASVVPTDASDRLYRCHARNDVMERTNSGAYARIQTSGSIANAPPVLMFASPASVVGLEKQQLTLRCFFSGSPDPSYTWTYGGTQILPKDWSRTNFDTAIISPASGLQPSDAGTFACMGINSAGQQSRTITLTVDAIPEFKNSSYCPSDMNVTDGDTVTIQCNAYAKPQATVTWFKNTVAFDRASLPPKFSLSGDLLTLTITDVCKNCSDGTSDLMNVQCNASNIHGHAFAQGYVNVLKATTITSEPTTVEWVAYQNVRFETAEAICDDSTPCETTWYYDDGENPAVEVVFDDRIFVDDMDGSLNIIMANYTDGGASRIGDYVCVVSNGYSDANITNVLSGEGPAVDTASANLWWVGLLVALLILLLILLVLLCCFFCLCSEGKSYPVDENERKNGNDPVREIKETGFQNYYVQTNSKSTSGNMFTNHYESQERLLAPDGGAQYTLALQMDDGTNLGVYNHSETGRFNENGSVGGMGGNSTMPTAGYSGVTVERAHGSEV